ncbi:hypothetical protein BGZ76_009264 [Entomortierella beljakovae]|nr:hypothetical protein BGZ76_009264 [Entomortierella beljakovae]
MRYFILSSLLASCALADVTYNVIGFPDASASSFGVLVNKKVTPLTTSNVTFPLWSATVAGATGKSRYQYVKLSENGTVLDQESFFRTLDHKKATGTLNEFYSRQVTKAKHPKIPQLYDDARPPFSGAFDDSQIGTIHLTANAATFADMVNNPLDEDKKNVKATFRFLNGDTVYNSGEVKLKISGHDTRYFKKLSIKIKFDEEKNDTFFGRPNIKLRSEVFDPTMIREKLYIDNLNALGVPSIQGAWTRLYVNGKPFGFYLMVEDISAPYLRTTVHGGDSTPADLGSLYEMGTHSLTEEATLQYTGSNTSDYNPEIYSNENLGNNTKQEPMAQLITFFKDLQDFNPTSAGGIEYWNSRLDLDGYLLSMAMEYLGGMWDGSWWRGNNFFFYFNPTQGKWQYLPTDFDRTFSDWNKIDVDTTYRNFAATNLARPSFDHPLITKLIYKNKDINARFEKLLNHAVKRLFNPRVLNAKINAYENFIQDEVKWDYALDRSNNPGNSFNFTIKDFHQGIVGGVLDAHIGIKPWIKNRAESVPRQVRGKKH